MPRSWSGRRMMGLFVAAALLATGTIAWWILRMPGSSHGGALPPLSDAERELARELRRDVEELAGAIGERHAEKPDALARAAGYVAARLSEAGPVDRQAFEAGGQRFENLVLEIPGGQEIVVVGAHYDSAVGSPAANDNGTGIAALIALAQALANDRLERTIRLVAFANEEPPFFKTPGMGSLVYAERCKKDGDAIVAMLSLETMGYYRDEAGTQRYPFPFSLFYPDRGDFIGFIGDARSRALVKQVVASFRRHAAFPSEGAALPASVPGVGWSDQWAFWQHGYPALMVTDTAPFRYPHYHTAEDTPDKVDYERLARVVAGLVAVVREIAST